MRGRIRSELRTCRTVEAERQVSAATDLRYNIPDRWQRTVLRVPSIAHTQCVEALLLTGIADPADVGDLQVTVLGVVVLHADVFRYTFRVFLHVVHFGMRNHTFGSNGVTGMTRKIDCVAAVHFPGAAVAGGQQEFVGTRALGKASGDASHLAL